MRYLLLGNGPASVHAVRAIRGVDPRGEIVLVTAEEREPYSPCVLADLLSEEGALHKARFVEPDFHQKHRVEVIAGEQAQRLSLKDKRVTTDKGREVRYDRLFIGTGADPLLPPLKGIDLPNVFTMKTLSDVEKIRKHAPKVKRAVLIGAGFISLETTQALLEMGKEVVIVEMMDRVLPNMLDADMAEPVQQMLSAQGVRLLLGQKVTAINGQGMAQSVSAGQEQIDCDMVIVSAGVKARIAMAKEAGLETGHGIRVDETMRTSDPDIFAAGDVAEGKNIFGEFQFLPNWPNATYGGRIAGANMAGGSLRAAGSEPVNIVTVFGMPVCSIGRFNAPEVIQTRQEDVLKKFYLEGDRIVGMQWLGTARNAGLIRAMINDARTMASYRPLLKGDLLNAGFGLPPAGPTASRIAS